LACRGEFFVNNLLDVKENDEHALHFDIQTPVYGSRFLSQQLV
jgi:hypothetical protein